MVQTMDTYFHLLEGIGGDAVDGSSGRPIADGLQYGCGMASPDCSAAHYVLPENRKKKESRRADSNRLPLLRVCGQWLPSVAGVCKFRIGIGFSVPCIAYYCRVLRAG